MGKNIGAVSAKKNKMFGEIFFPVHSSLRPFKIYCVFHAHGFLYLSCLNLNFKCPRIWNIPYINIA